MKVVCTKEVSAFDIQMTQNDYDQYWRFEWLQSCPSTGSLPEEVKTVNKQRWKFGGFPCIAVIEDTDTSILGLAISKSQASRTASLLCMLFATSIPWQQNTTTGQGAGQASSASCSLLTILSPGRTCSYTAAFLVSFLQLTRPVGCTLVSW